MVPVAGANADASVVANAGANADANADASVAANADANVVANAGANADANADASVAANADANAGANADLNADANADANAIEVSIKILDEILPQNNQKVQKLFDIVKTSLRFLKQLNTVNERPLYELTISHVRQLLTSMKTHVDIDKTSIAVQMFEKSLDLYY